MTAPSQPQSASASDATRTEPLIGPPISVTPAEQSLFDKLLACLTHHNRPDVQIRIAGGWVRDKLLQLHSDDIDIVLDSMSGVAFAQLMQDYASHAQLSCSSFGVIPPNPQQSKHLETATFTLDGTSLDVNQFRSEVYSADSRIPLIEASDARQDALRRDLTVNAMFYNLRTRQVEDWTSGLADLLQLRVVRTPRNAMKTLSDDPLRLLRAVRFAGRFQLQVDPELAKAACAPAVHHDLQHKVSRERIGKEIVKMCQLPATIGGCFQLLSEWRLRTIILAISKPMDSIEPEEQHATSAIQALPIASLSGGPKCTPADELQITQLCQQTLGEALRHRAQHEQHYNAQQSTVLALAAYLSPYNGWLHRIKTNKTISLPALLCREALTLPHSLADQIADAIKAAYQLLQLSTQFSSTSPSDEFVLACGQLLRSTTKANWRLALDLALAINQTRAIVPDDGVTELAAWLASSGLVRRQVWVVKPVLDGRQIKALFGSAVNGPVLGQVMERLVHWMMLHIDDLEPLNQAQLAATEFLKQEVPKLSAASQPANNGKR